MTERPVATQRRMDPFATIQEALNIVEFGLSIFDRDDRLLFANIGWRKLFDLPDDLCGPGTSLSRFLMHLAEEGDLGPGTPEDLVRGALDDLHARSRPRIDLVRPNGRVLCVELTFLPSGGHLALITDVTRERAAEDQLTRYMEDMELERAATAQQAEEIVQLAEHLDAQKRAVELEKSRSDYLAAHDPLTGLPNRRKLIERLESAIRQKGRAGERTAVFFVDLDKFKQVNDSFGHERGDAHLAEVAERLTAVARQDDFVARLGGDEFAVVVRLRKGTSHDAVHRMAERFHAALQIRVNGPCGAIDAGACIGVAIHPDHADNVDTLLACADAAMYEVKKAGGNRIMFCSDL